VHIVDDSNLSDYIALPSFVIAKRPGFSATHFSDLLRTALLSEHGGTWIDATVYLTAPVDGILSQMRPSGFFAFTRPNDPFLLSSWFLATEARNPLMALWRDLLYTYWSEHDALVHYFLLHFLFEVAVTLSDRARAAWEQVPLESYLPPHALQERLLQPYDEGIFVRICQSTAIHKLTHKLSDERGANGPRRFLDFICDRI
jgi:hypothetical protein